MTEARASRRSAPVPVFWVSLLLFCVLLGLLTYRFSIGQDPSGAGASTAPAPPPARKVIVRRVVTTVIPAAPGAAAAESGAAPSAVEAPAPESEAVPVSEPVTSAS
jgi:hypothetical protein